MDHTQPILDDLHFPEGPRPYQDGILFSDFYRYAVIAVDSSGKAREICRVDNQPSGLGFSPDGDLLIVSMLDRRLLKLDAQALAANASVTAPTEVANISDLAPSHCNDMIVDAQGRAYIGNFGSDRYRGEEPRSTNLIRVDPDGSAKAVADDLMFPNGTVITPDARPSLSPRVAAAVSRLFALMNMEICTTAASGPISASVFQTGFALTRKARFGLQTHAMVASFAFMKAGTSPTRSPRLAAMPMHACWLAPNGAHCLYAPPRPQAPMPSNSAPGTSKHRPLTSPAQACPNVLWPQPVAGLPRSDTVASRNAAAGRRDCAGQFLSTRPPQTTETVASTPSPAR